MHTKITTLFRTAIGAALAAAAVSGCSPKFDWRDFRSAEAPYAVLFPGKPATHTRSISLGGETVKMQMAAAEVDGVTFAVGAAEMADAAQAQAAITAMKNTMVANIGGTVTAEKQASAAASSGGVSQQQQSIDVEAKGARNGEALRLVGRFIARDKRVYQLVVIGKDKHMVNDEIDTFMRSFKLN
ncbi:hypothetical protein ASD15_25915 [Massilia sp. Root351]|jgi:hypothetical protein|uniref:hypothetical protein n=1 Tax=Massilia sp. Root351 TaxID=1736522 RepID=UPI00070C22E4|nr:hypothetical protein [Massilia sp. Root351]KQV88528.1 hypothetical protein ASD15_25915 [Massilia sp. Root351]